MPFLQYVVQFARGADVQALLTNFPLTYRLRQLAAEASSTEKANNPIPKTIITLVVINLMEYSSVQNNQYQRPAA
jgi:hypothetical protein